MSVALTKGVLRNTCSPSGPWLDGVVPFTVELGAGDPQAVHGPVGDLESRRVLDGVEVGVDLQASRRRCEQVRDGSPAEQRLATSVLQDVREDMMLDLVSLARAGRQVAYGDRKASVVRQSLEFPLPEAHTGPVAPAAGRDDEESMRPSVRCRPDSAPPAPDRGDGELRGVVIDSDADPALVVRDVLDPVGDRRPVPVHEVVDDDLVNVPVAAPLAARVLVGRSHIYLPRASGLRAPKWRVRESRKQRNPRAQVRMGPETGYARCRWGSDDTVREATR
jgi:hypothetical protein